MAVPSYQALMLPQLQALATAREHDVRSVRDALTDQLRLSAKDVAEKLPSVRGALITSRMNWARTFLSRAGLVSVVRRGSYCITPAGLERRGMSAKEVTLEMLKRTLGHPRVPRPRTQRAGPTPRYLRYR